MKPAIKPVIKICKHQCNECLFSKNRIVSSERMKDILESCKAEGSFFECHKGTIVGERIACAGFFETIPNPFLQVASRLGAAEYVDPEEVLIAGIEKQRNESRQQSGR